MSNSTKNTKRSGSGASRSGSTRAAGSRSGASRGSRSRQSRSRQSAAPERDLTPLVITAVCVAAGALFFLGNLGLMSVVGDFFHGLMMGLFGVMGYVFPIGLAVGAVLWFYYAVYLAEVPERTVYLKLFGAVVAFVFFCTLFHAARTADPAASVRAADLYRGSIDHPAGGLLGGGIAHALAKGVGRGGCILISLILAVIGLVVLLWEPIRDQIIPLIREGREGAAERLAERQEARRAQRREERRAGRERYYEEEPEEYYEDPAPADDRQVFRGVTKNTSLSSMPEPRLRNSGGSRSGSTHEASDALMDRTPLEGTISGIDSGYRAAQPARKSAQPQNRADELSDVKLGRIEEETPFAQEEPAPEVHRETPAPEFGLQDTPDKRNSDERIAASRFRFTNAELQKIDDLHSNMSGLKNPEYQQDSIYIDSETGTVFEDRYAAARKDEGRPDAGRRYYQDRELSADDYAAISYGDEEPEAPADPYEEAAQTESYPGEFEDRASGVTYDTSEIYEETPAYAEEEPPFEENAYEYEPDEEQGAESEDHYGRSMDGVESRTVETANGMKIEADIDPNDPIAARLRQKEYERKHPTEVKDPFAYGNVEAPESIDAEDLNGTATRTPAAREPHSTMGQARSGTFRQSGSGSGTGVGGNSGNNAPSGQEPAQAEPAKVKKKKGKPYHAPYYNMLAAPKSTGKGNDSELRETAQRLQQTLRDFGVGVTVTDWQRGPSVTRYEIQPDQGVKVSKILSYADDIKLSLAVADVRIEAPIPGKSAIGIEVPNKESTSVTLREVVDSEEFKKHRSKLAFAVGKDIAGQVIIADLAKMPHLLIAGTTGSGKSVCVNGLIVSMLYHAKPSEVGFIMIDPKMVELKVYEGIPHLLYPVVTDPKKAAAALNWAVNEMVARYKKFADYNVRDLKGYNQKVEEELEAGNTDMGPKMKQIVIIVDELADLMMTSPKEVEEAIFRLAQMARAAGLHLVIVTQRPSVNVVTGTIKANIPSRIALKVASGVDSRTILDMNGAEKLLGWGDMLYYPSGAQKPTRVQGCYVSDEEVTEITEFLQKMDPDDADEREEIQIVDVTANDSGSGSGGSGGAASDGSDELYLEIGRFVTEQQKPVSIGMLQRKFRIGFNRAARIVDQLAEEGVVSPDMGDKKPREVLMSAQEFRSIYG